MRVIEFDLDYFPEKFQIEVHSNYIIFLKLDTVDFRYSDVGYSESPDIAIG